MLCTRVEGAQRAPAPGFAIKTCKNTKLFHISPLRPSKNTQKHDTFRHFLPSTMQKHTKTLLFTTCPPFDHAKTHKNIAIYDTSPLRHHKNTAIYNTSPHLPPSTKQKHTKPLLFTTLRPFDTT